MLFRSMKIVVMMTLNEIIGLRTMKERIGLKKVRGEVGEYEDKDYKKIR